jgi:hypothetical protein
MRRQSTSVDHWFWRKPRVKQLEQLDLATDTFRE